MHEQLMRPAEVDTTAKAIEYIAQQLGVQKPIGVKARSIANKRFEDEMSEQRWTFDHLVATVRYMKDRGIHARRPDYVFYHVADAVKNNYLPRRKTISTWDELHQKVIEAVELESNPSWERRLLLAKGDALQKVYAEWVEKRLPALGAAP